MIGLCGDYLAFRPANTLKGVFVFGVCMHYYQHHIGDFTQATARLSDGQCMAYLRMLWMYYEAESPFDCDADAIAFKIGANASDVHQILKHFFFEHDGKWHHARCDKEILAYRKKSASAKIGADVRWKNAKAMRTHTERNAIEHVSDANHKPITNNQKKKEKQDGAERLVLSQTLQEHGVSKDIADAFMQHRKRKKAPVTELAFKRLQTEAEKAGWTLEAALREVIEMDWKGFLAEYVKGRQPPDQAHPAKPWFESWSGIVAKGAEYGLSWEEAQAKGIHESRFKARVFQLSGRTE